MANENGLAGEWDQWIGPPKIVVAQVRSTMTSAVGPMG